MSADVSITDHGITVTSGTYDVGTGDGVSLQVAGEDYPRTQITTEGVAFGDGTSAPVVSPALHEIGETGEPAFTNSWDNVTGNTSVFYHFGPFVFIDIVVEGGAAASSVFTLPVGSRPAANTSRIINATSDGSTWTNSVCVVGSDGTVAVFADGTTNAVKAYFSFIHA